MIKGTEMSVLNPVLPKYYKGFDIDVLIQKINDGNPLTKDEGIAIDEAFDVFYKKQFEENQKKAEAWMRAHPGEYTKNVDPGRITKDRTNLWN